MPRITTFRQTNRQHQLKEGRNVSLAIGRNIPFCDSMLKAQLYDLIKLNKPEHKCYVTDQILADKGHNVLRLPPYHPDLNTTELIWANVKQWVASKNTTFKIYYVEQLCRQKFE
jgi:hypothetical protein